MFLLNFTTYTVVDGVPVSSATNGIPVTNSRAKLEMVVAFLLALMRATEYREDVHPLALALRSLITEYRKVVCDSVAPENARLWKRELPDDIEQLLLEMVVEGTLRNETPYKAAARWLLDEIEKPVPCSIRKVA